jgi:hypothetical protein
MLVQMMVVLGRTMGHFLVRIEQQRAKKEHQWSFGCFALQFGQSLIEK